MSHPNQTPEARAAIGERTRANARARRGRLLAIERERMLVAGPSRERVLANLSPDERQRYRDLARLAAPSARRAG